MPKLLLGSASGLHRSLECPASIHLGPKREDPPGEAAERGHRIHSFLEHAPEDLEKALEHAGKNRKTCEKIDISETAGYYTTPGLRELKLVYNTESDSSRLVEVRGNRAYGDLSPGDVPGTADVVILGFHNVEVWDYKTGRVPVFAENNTQLLHLGLMVSQTIAPHAERFTLGIQQLQSYGKWSNSVWEVDKFDLDEHKEKMRKSLDRSKKALKLVDEGKDPVVNRGDWCDYCPAQKHCPAWR